MPPSKSGSSAAKKKTPTTDHPPYKDMISEAITSLKDRMGSSRQAIKKYIHANYPKLGANADSLINQTIKRGVEKGDFSQPKGPSGPIKLNKKVKSEGEKKPAAKKSKPAAKKASPKRAGTGSGAAAAGKKKTATKKSSTAKPKATAKKAAPKKAAPKKAAKPKKPATKKTKKA